MKNASLNRVINGLLTGLFTIFLLISCNKQVDPPKKPNVIYILADDMGYGDVTSYNANSKIKTPYLDELAKEGMMFTDAHTSSSVCTPTRYGILTGRYNWRSTLKSGVLTGKSKALIPRQRTTVASMLKKNDYHTAFIGKWHLGWDWALKNTTDTTGVGWNKNDFDIIDFTKPVTNTPNDLGFDYAYGHSGSLDMAPYVYVENGMVTAQPDTVTVDTGKYSWWREGPTGADFIHEQVTPNFFNRADNYIKERANTKQPFYLYLALPSPHTPILPTKEWDGKSEFLPYADFVMMIDNYIGKLMQTLKEEGLDKNTMVIFTTDNGCSPAAGFDLMVEQGHKPSYVYRGHKADIYEGGHRVPFIVKWPNQITPSSLNDETVCTTDLMATLADILEYPLEANEGEDSYSMLPLFKNGKGDREAIIHHSINGSFAIRKGDWKLIMAGGSGGWSYPNRGKNAAVLDSLPPIQLYHLKNDPGETNNLQASDPKKVAELRAILKKYILDGRSTPGPKQKNDSIQGEWKQIKFLNASL